MVAPLIGVAAAAAAKLAAKKLAQQAAKKVAKSAAGRARSNSAAATKATKTTKAVTPSKPTVKKAPYAMVGQTIKISSDSTRKVINKPVMLKKKAAVKPVGATTPTAQQSIDAARKALGSTKPDPKALARKITQDKAREMERIRKQGRNTR